MPLVSGPLAVAVSRLSVTAGSRIRCRDKRRYSIDPSAATAFPTTSFGRGIYFAILRIPVFDIADGAGCLLDQCGHAAVASARNTRRPGDRCSFSNLAFEIRAGRTEVFGENERLWRTGRRGRNTG
jgi:hypothetical protein